MLRSIVSLLFALAIGIVGPAYGQEEPKFNVYLTNEVEEGYPTQKQMTEFSCSDRIYIVIEALGLSSEDHQMTVSWRDPTDAQQELTNYTFKGQDYNRIWAWLQLSGPPGAVFGQIFDPSFGMEDFIGEWRAIVSLNRKKLAELPFNVLC